MRWRRCLFYIYVIGVYCAWVMCFANGKNGGLAAMIQKKSINFVVEMVSHAGGSAEPGKGTGCDSPTVPAAVIPVRRCAQSSDKSHRIKVTDALASGRRDGPG